jgi:hypothetical protein
MPERRRGRLQKLNPPVDVQESKEASVNEAVQKLKESTTVNEDTQELKEPSVKEPTTVNEAVHNLKQQIKALQDTCAKPNSCPRFSEEDIQRLHDVIASMHESIRAIHRPMNNVFLFVLKHGGYKINQDYAYDIVKCPVQHLIRLQFAPLGACTVLLSDADGGQQLYPTLLEEKDQLTNPKLSEADILKRMTEIADIGKNLKMAKVVPEDVELFVLPGQRKMNDHLDESNIIVETRLGDNMLNKIYTIELDPIHPDHRFCGIPVLFDVTFKLPDIFKHNAPQLEALITHLSSYPPRPFSIGEYNATTGEITYRAETELLSCPYFEYFLFLNKEPFEFYKAVSLTKNNNGTYEPRPMIHEVSSDMVFRYFQYANMVVHFDFSCSFFVFDEDTNKELSTLNPADVYALLDSKGLYTRNPGDPRGGKTKRTNKRMKRRRRRRRTVKRQRKRTKK